MCLAMPTRIQRLEETGMGIVTLGGVDLHVSLELIDDPQVGDYVLVHVGHALCKLDVAEAEKTLALFAEIAASQGPEPAK